MNGTYVPSCFERHRILNQMAEKKNIKVKTVCCVSAEIVLYNLNCAQKEIVIKVMSAT